MIKESSILKTFSKILVANRGEIAVRIIKTAKRMGILTVTVFSEADRNSLHVSRADKSVLLPGRTLQETYLDQQKIIRIALEQKAEAIHPGYGFLAENADFAAAVEQAGLIFIGPAPEQIRLMGEKSKAIELADTLDIPVLRSIQGNKKELFSKAGKIGYPLMVKAVSGGGGKGMFIVFSKEELQPALDKAERQAFEYFGNRALFIEKYILNARHIEVQLLGDRYGTLIHLYERECSIQRRFQKIVEEAPSAFVNDDLREKLCSAALKIGQKVGYRGVGTVEFLVDENGNFWFLEMNTRIQVEHPLTEVLTGVDLVEQQIMVAAGNTLSIKQEDVALNGHAIEARICAEDVEKDFLPSSGVVEKYWLPEDVKLRTDSFIQEQTEISPFYDSLLAKQIAYGKNREEAIGALQQSLSSTAIAGLQTNIPFLLQLLADSRFRKNEISASLLNNFRFQQVEKPVLLAAAYLYFHFFRTNKASALNLWQHLGFWRQNLQFSIWIDGKQYEMSMMENQHRLHICFQKEMFSFSQVEQNDQWLVIREKKELEVFFFQEKQSETNIFVLGKGYSVRSNLIAGQFRIEKKPERTGKSFRQKIRSDLYGKVLSVEVKPGSLVDEGTVLLIIESMKTEFRILCPQNSTVKKIHIDAGEMIKDGQLLVELSAENSNNQVSKRSGISETSVKF